MRPPLGALFHRHKILAAQIFEGPDVGSVRLGKDDPAEQCMIAAGHLSGDR
jgi:hypothetical protein